MQLTIKGHIYAKQDSWNPTPEYTFFDFDNPHGWVMVIPHEFIVEIPDNFDVRPGLVANLEHEKEKVKAEFAARITELNARIQSLLAIENKPTAEAEVNIPF